MSNVIEVDFGREYTLKTRYPYIVAYCQYKGYREFTMKILLKQAEKDRPGRYALYPKGLKRWRLLHDYADQENRDALIDLVTLKGLEP